MSYISGTDRSQTMLLPASIDDYVGPDNPVRFIDAFVDQLDLATLGFVRSHPERTGRPGYHPGDLLKLYIYGYLNRVRSSRRLEIETRRNIEVIWLMRQLAPDFKTIADFRKNNRGAFRAVFREFTALCRNLDLFGRQLIAVDGSRIKAVNNWDRTFVKSKVEKSIRETDERLERYLKTLDEADQSDEVEPNPDQIEGLKAKIDAIRERRARLTGYHKTMSATGETQLSLTDPDARAMAAGTRIGVGYNVQIAVDERHKLIVEQQVHNNVADMGLLTETAAAAKATLGVDQIDVVADKGYFRIEDIEACEAAGITPFVPKPLRGPARRDGHLPKEEFSYDPGTDTYLCPGGRVLAFRRKREIRTGVQVSDYGKPGTCNGCEMIGNCTSGTFRSIARFKNEDILERMAERLAARPDILDTRRETVEHPFGSIKQWMGQSAFLMRRLENVRGEFSLTALAYNIRRAISIVGIPSLLAAVRG